MCIASLCKSSDSSLCSSRSQRRSGVVSPTNTPRLSLLLQTNMTFLLPARHLSCMATLLSQPHVILERCTALNPTTLMPTEEDGDHHDCQEAATKNAKVRKDLTDQLLDKGEVLYVDGSAKKDSTPTLQCTHLHNTGTTEAWSPLPGNQSHMHSCYRNC